MSGANKSNKANKSDESYNRWSVKEWWSNNGNIVTKLGIGIVVGFVVIGGGYVLLNKE